MGLTGRDGSGVAREKLGRLDPHPPRQKVGPVLGTRKFHRLKSRTAAHERKVTWPYFGIKYRQLERVLPSSFVVRRVTEGTKGVLVGTRI